MNRNKDSSVDAYPIEYFVFRNGLHVIIKNLKPFNFSLDEEDEPSPQTTLDHLE
jgi:hypothetical protein